MRRLIVQILGWILIGTIASVSSQFFEPPAFFGKEQKPLGKYCGILQETDSLDKPRSYNCRGAVWALDENRIYLTGFSFQSSIYRPENITFWLGPAKEPARFADEIIPSDNGIYLEPKELSLQSFLVKNNTFKIAKKPSTQQVESLLSLLASASSKKSANSTNSTVVKSKSDSPGKLGKEDAIPESSASAQDTKKKKVEPHPSAEPEPTPSGKSISNSSAIQDGAKFEADLEILSAIDGNRSIDRYWNETIDRSDNRSRDTWPGNLLNHVTIHSTRNSSLSSDRSIEIDSSLRSLSNFSDDGDRWNGTVEIDLVIGAGSTIKVTRPYARKWRVTTSVRTATTTTLASVEIDLNSNSSGKGENVSNSSKDESTNGTTIGRPETAVAVGGRESNGSKLTMKPLSWYAGAQPLILEIPKDRKLSEFRWLSVWDHTRHYPIATVLFPSGPGFSIPNTHVLNGFRPALSKDVRSGPIEILDTKTIRINDFHFEGDAPGAWFYVGRSLIPVANGDIVPIYDEGGKFDCDFLGAYENRTIILKMPGDLEVTDIFWLSVFCLPYGISFAHVYLPYKDLNVPTAMDFQSAPRCMLEP